MFLLAIGDCPERAKCSQSCPNSPNAHSSGIDAVERGRPFGSNAPIINPPA